MPSIIYFIRTSKTDPKKRVSIYLRLRDGRKVDITAKTGLEVLPGQFSNETHQIRQRADYKEKEKDKERLKNLETWVLTEYKNIKDDPTSDWLKLTIDRFNRPDKYKSKPVTLFSFIDGFIERAPTRILDTGKVASERTIQDYKKTQSDLKEFASYQGKEDYVFKDINKGFYDELVLYLTYDKKYALNTVGKKIKLLKVFLNAASPEHILREQFSNFKVLTEESDAIYLNEDELRKIYETDLSKEPHLDRVRDLFIVACWTGLRFSELTHVRKENINNGLLKFQQNKTSNYVTIPLYPIVVEILKKYDQKLPEPVANQKFNEYLRDVAKEAKLKDGVTKYITKAGKKETTFLMKWEVVGTHTARRSFATNMFKRNVPTITIMAITGHKTESSFLKYIKITKEEQAQLLKEMWRDSGSHLKVVK